MIFAMVRDGAMLGVASHLLAPPPRSPGITA